MCASECFDMTALSFRGGNLPFRVLAAGPSPAPVAPWHMTQWRLYSAAPFAIDSGVAAGAAAGAAPVVGFACPAKTALTQTSDSAPVNPTNVRMIIGNKSS